MPKQKAILFLQLDSQLLSMVSQWFFEWLYSYFCEKSREEWWNPLCASICAIIRENKKKKVKGNESEDMLLQTNTSGWARCPSHFSDYVTISTLPLPPIPIQPGFLPLRIMTSLPYRDQLENPVLILGHRYLAWHHHLRPDRVPNFG